MASVVDICNLALAHLGDAARVSAISPPDSVQAEHCNRFYPIARNVLLEAPRNGWSFARKRTALSRLVTTETPDAYAYTYAWPNGCLRVLRVLEDGATDDDTGVEFVSETLTSGDKVVHTSAEAPIAVYVSQIEDPTKFSTLFTAALARLLASYLAGPIMKGEAGRKEGVAQYKVYVGVDYPAAIAADAAQGRNTSYVDFTPSAITARA